MIAALQRIVAERHNAVVVAYQHTVAERRIAVALIANDAVWNHIVAVVAAVSAVDVTWWNPAAESCSTVVQIVAAVWNSTVPHVEGEA